jgi:putative membrane protein
MQRMQRLDLLRRQFRWKLLLLRLVVNTLALLVVAIIVPNIYFVDRQLIVLLIAGALFGLLNTIVKPIFQFLTLRLLFASYGLVVVFINALMLLLLGRLFPRTLAVDGFFWALVGGALIGIVSSFFENLLGVNPPFLFLAEQRARGDAAGPADGRHGLMGLMLGREAGEAISAPEPPVTEVNDESNDARQSTGEPAPTAGL